MKEKIESSKKLKVSSWDFLGVSRGVLEYPVSWGDQTDLFVRFGISMDPVQGR